MLKVVLDTNVIVSGLNFPTSIPAKILLLVASGEVANFTSRHIVNETRRILMDKFSWKHERVEAAEVWLKTFSKSVNPQRHISVIVDDPDNRMGGIIMAESEIPTSGDIVIKPSHRAFFVHYVAMFLVFVGPRLNPEVGLPVWLGTLLGLIVLAAVIYQKFGQEYRVTSRGVVRAWRWPSPRQHEIVWENLDEVLVLRGLTQTVLQVGNLAFRDKAGGPEMFWYGLLNPKEVKALIDGKRP